jgi:hypothetical protein
VLGRGLGWRKRLRRLPLVAAVASVVLGLAPGAAGQSAAVAPTPTNSSPYSDLFAVACAGPSFCTAVGEGAVIEDWDGTSWSVAEASSASSAGSESLDGAACASAARCFAVGSHSEGTSGFQTVVEAWDGTSWSVVPSPTPSGGGVLLGASCPAPTRCFAVGVETGSPPTPLVEAWDGTSWSVVPSPTPSGGGQLSGVACPSASLCFAVGSTGGGGPLVEQWDGSSWQVAAVPSPGQGATLAGVGCTPDGLCVAAGSTGGPAAPSSATVLEAYDGWSWSLVPSPSPSSDSVLEGAACASTTRCFAVGSYRSSSGGGSLVLAVAFQSPASSIPLTRVAGSNRDLTSVEASEAAFPAAGSAKAVVVASDADFPDALSGTPLAVAKDAPLLLTTPSSLDPAVAKEIERVAPSGSTVYLLGGTAALSSTVEDQVAALGDDPVRLAGQTRFGTAVAVAQALGEPSNVLLATGLDFPDGLAAGVAAAHLGAAVLLTNGTEQAPETAAYLEAHPGSVLAVGGPACAADPEASCVAGTTRFATAVELAELEFPSPSTLAFASGLAFPDALSGGALVGKAGGPILLVPASGALPTELYAYLQRTTAGQGIALGGPAAVSPEVVDEIG